ncbi:hypothetical protein L218DRAFT_671210 [Marasmius fiardii PR-910]|nr:hypothetical protein L218DRAFT_671210 [Marasmius fiardii PR-910]
MSSSSRTQMYRGSACLTCRKRKVKCDGRRPICEACSTFAPGGCRYADGELSKDQALELEIESMEDRLRQLQSAGGSPSSSSRGTMSLHSPYSTSSGSSGSPGPTRLIFRDAPSAIRRKWLHTFINYASVFGFFLDTSKFETHQPSVPLLHAAYLLGAFISRDRESASYEQDLLSVTLHEIAQGLAGTHSDRLIHTIQAQVLVANYFFVCGRALEGKYHVAAAISLVLGASFHKIGSSQQHLLPRLGVNAPPFSQSATEDIEKIRALWMVLIMNHCWTSADGASSNISYDRPESRIDAPWPLDIERQSQSLSSLSSGNTIQNFLKGNPDDGDSLFALHAKAAILFEQASFLHRQYRPNLSLRDATRFQSTFNNLDHLIRRFISSLPPVTATRPPALRRLMLIHTLARVSSIQMHYIFAAQDASSHSLILTTAESIISSLRSIELDDFPFIDPIMATLWAATAKVFIEEIVASRASRSGSHRRRSPHELMSSVELIISFMTKFSPYSEMMDTQLRRVRQSYARARE